MYSEFFAAYHKVAFNLLFAWYDSCQPKVLAYALSMTFGAPCIQSELSPIHSDVFNTVAPEFGCQVYA